MKGTASCVLLLLILVNAGCSNRGAQERRIRRADQVQAAICGQQVNDTCKVAALNGDNGPLLAVKYSLATDVLTVELARDAELTNHLLDDGFVEVAVSDGQYFWRRWKLVRQASAKTSPKIDGPDQNNQDKELAVRVEELIRRNDEVEVQVGIDRSGGTARLFSDSMAEVSAKSITNDDELRSLLKAKGIKRVVIADSQMTWRDFELGQGAQP